MILKTDGNRTIPPAFVDRFLYRGLWKLVQSTDGSVCVVPTRRLIALVMLFGEVAYPSELLDTHFQMVGSRVSAKNRSPYELPGSMMVSFYPIPIERSTPILAWLLHEGLLVRYEENIPPDLEDLLTRAHLTQEELAAWIERLLAASPDWLDKFRGDRRAIAESSWRECAPAIVTVLQNSRVSHAYPAMISPEASLWWCERLNNGLAPVAEAEIGLSDLLPDRLLNFADLATLATHPKACSLRRALAVRLAKGIAPGPGEELEQAVRDAASLVESFGRPYLDAMCSVWEPGGFAEPFGHFSESRPASEGIEYLDNQLTHVRHRAAFALACASGAQPELQLIQECSSELWLKHLTQYDLQRSTQGSGPWGKSGSLSLLRPF